MLRFLSLRDFAAASDLEPEAGCEPWGGGTSEEVTVHRARAGSSGQNIGSDRLRPELGCEGVEDEGAKVVTTARVRTKMGTRISTRVRVRRV